VTSEPSNKSEKLYPCCEHCGGASHAVEKDAHIVPCPLCQRMSLSREPEPAQPGFVYAEPETLGALVRDLEDLIDHNIHAFALFVQKRYFAMGGFDPDKEMQEFWKEHVSYSIKEVGDSGGSTAENE